MSRLLLKHVFDCQILWSKRDVFVTVGGRLCRLACVFEVFQTDMRLHTIFKFICPSLAVIGVSVI